MSDVPSSVDTGVSAPVSAPAAAATGAEKTDKKDKKEKKEKVDKKKKDPSAAAAGEEEETAENENEARKEWVMPEFIVNRLAIWDRIFAEKEKERLAKTEKKPINITLPDGKVIVGESGITSSLDVAKQISNSLAERVLIARVNGELRDLSIPLESDCTLQLLDFETKEGQHTFWHSSAHILGQAIEKQFKDARLCIGPPLEEGGFYYDVFLGENVVHPDDLKSLERTIATVQKQKQPFVRLVLKKEEALEMFKENRFKQEIIQSKVPDGATCTAYRCGPLVDLCKGPHVPSTGNIKAMSVTKSSSAYWMAKAENPSLQRVYGISFPDKKKLKEYKELLKQAEERDHRRLGQQQELFFFHPWSPGSAFFLPHGTRIYNKLMNFIRDQYYQRGYTEVISPNVYNVELWKTSGHWQNYQENMFSFKCEDADFAIKPMNCPGHCLMFANTLRSYRELPIRFADFGVLHRNEVSGALTGLTRVRRFQQDDAHIFCRQDQIEQEVGAVLDMLKVTYGIFGFTFHLNLSTRPEKFLGEVEVWNKAEEALSKVLKSTFGDNWDINHGDGAFYGPKIDIQLTDALKRKHQCATIQLDFQLPLRFQLQYKGQHEGFETPVIIHRAILGSVERMIAVLIEHTGGKWPFWLSPRQAIVIPIGEAYFEYAEKVRALIHSHNFYVDVELSNKQLAKKVREAQLSQYNYILVVGQKELEGNAVNVRLRDNPEHTYNRTLDELIDELKQNTANFK